MTIRPSTFLLYASVAFGATLLACGDDSSNNNDEDRQQATNGNGNGNGGMDAGAATVCALPFQECATCGEPPCLQECQNGQLGECFSLAAAGEDLVNQIVDSGVIEDLEQAVQDGINAFLDSGIVSRRDGGVSFNVGNDASIDVETKPCPEPLVCSSQSDDPFIMGLAELVGGLGVCVQADTSFPPACTMANAPEECDSLGFENVMCSAPAPLGMCLQACQ